ncbi:MAG: hydrogenase expression/formation protein HypE [Bacteroidales bacterium]|nr:hydrogenase expression/formation protein HypE [Bacteroidales bacterium]
MLITDIAEMDNRILLGHGSGGQLSHDLISGLFVKYFDNPILKDQTDSAILKIDKDLLAFTTDSFVVDPVFFPGGNIGTLAVAGTVNDLAVSGATPLYLSSSFIIEEGFGMKELETIVRSMAEEAKRAGVMIVTGDTKVVDKGKCDKIFINTSGIGELLKRHKNISSGKEIKTGDKIIVNGSIGDHGMAILAAREFLNLSSDLKSDCACLNLMIRKAMGASPNIKFMRDATRGGLATVLSELTSDREFGLHIDESSIQINEKVKGMCEILGFDPLYVANEGKIVMVVDKDDAESVLDALRADELGRESTVIGEIVDDHPGKAWINTIIGGNRILDMLAGEQLPRIC